MGDTPILSHPSLLSTSIPVCELGWGVKDARTHPDHSITSLIWVCASPDGSCAWFRAEQGPKDAPGMQGGRGHLVLGGMISPAPLLGCTSLPGLESGP